MTTKRRYEDDSHAELRGERVRGIIRVELNWLVRTHSLTRYPGTDGLWRDTIHQYERGAEVSDEKPRVDGQSRSAAEHLDFRA